MAKTKKKKTPNRPLTVEWLTTEIREMIKSCDDNIKIDQKAADRARSDERAKYDARVETDKHHRRELQRLLDGKTWSEALGERIFSRARRR